MTDPLKDIANSLRAHVASFADTVAERLDSDPALELRVPLSVLMVAPSCDPNASALQWITLLQMVEDDPDKKPGYGHALTLSRDLIGFLDRLNHDFALGLPTKELFAHHPLYEKITRGKPN